MNTGTTSGEDHLKRVRAFVTGRVQGVGFRAWVQQLALGSEMTGEAANLADGRVMVEVQGSVAAVEHLLAALWQGPSMASVEDVAVNEVPVDRAESGFRIR